MRGLFKKSTSWLLIFALIIGMLPALVLPTSAASNMENGFEGQDADIFSALGFDTSKMPEGFDAETTDNPYGRDTILGNQVFEALISSSGGTASYGKDNNSVSAGTISGMPSSGAKIGMVMYAVATGDFDGDGLPGEVVYVGYDKIHYNDYQTKANLMLQVYDAKSGSISGTKTIGAFNPAQATTKGGTLYSQYDYAWQNLLQVTAGDYDCDGISEIAVYVAEDGNCRVDIYKYQKTSQSPANGWLTIGNWTRVWTYVVTNTGNKMHNMVSLVSGDFNQDGIDDLGVSYGRLAPHRDDNSFESLETDKSQAAILWGAKSDMLQSICKLDLNEAELGEQTRVSLTTGDLDGDGNKELIATGQPISDVVNHFNINTSNTTRSIITYLYDSTLGMTINTSGLYKPVDGEVVSYTDGDGKTTTSWRANNGFDDNYYSQPLMRTNAAAFKPQGHDYAYLYLDSCLYEYMEGQLTLKMSLDDPTYDGSQTIGGSGTWGVDRIAPNVSLFEFALKWSYNNAFKDSGKLEYVEYGAVAADINGDGYDTLMTNFYRSNSKNDGAGKHFATYATLYADGEGKLNTAHSGSKIAYSANDKNDYQLYSDDALSTVALSMVDIDLDTVIIEYTGLHYLTYSDPKVLAIIAAAPYFEDVDVISDYDYAWQNTTTYSFMVGDGHADLSAVDFEGGAYISCEQEISGGKLEIETSMNYTLEWQTETTKTTEYTMTFETSQDEDSVVFFSTPTEHYVYRFKVPDGKGGYTETIDTISNTFTPAYQVLTLDYYESIQANYDTLPSIKGEALTSTPGDPSSYPASTSGYNVIAQWNTDPAGVSFGNGAITQEITITEEEAESYNMGFAWDFQFGGGLGAQLDLAQFEYDTTAGVQWSLNPTWGWSNINLTGSSFSGTVTNMPLEFQDYGYYYNWKLFAYNYKFSDGTSVPVVSYVVGDISQPPELPDDFQQDYDRSTSEKNVLTWTYDKPFSSFYIYKYYDFPVGGGLQLVEEIPSSTPNYSVKYNEEGKPYKEYYFEDDNLAAYTEYEYAIQVERLSKTPPLSAPSGLLTARTKAAVGYPSMVIAESDGENDGKLLVYPDKNSYLTVNATGPEGEAPNSYYTTVQYQWQKQEKGAWTDMENQTNMTLTFANAGSETAGTYRCRVNVLTKADATAITAYTDPVTLTHAFRSSYVDEVYIKDVTGGGVELYAKIANGHSDSASIPGGKVIFNLINNATGRHYQRSVDLNTAGIANIVLDDMLDEGMYSVNVYYYGTKIFKACSDQTLYLSQRDSGYDVDAPISVTYGDGTQIIHRLVTKDQGMTVTQEAKAGEYALLKGDSLSTQPPYYRGFFFALLYWPTETFDGHYVTAGSNYYITIDTVKYYFTASYSGTITLDGMYVTYGDASSYLTYANDGGKYDLARNTPAGNYVIKMTTEGETIHTALTVDKRPITLQLPKQKGAEGIDAPIIKLGSLELISGSWADCDMPDGLLHSDLADLQLDLDYINTAGSVYTRQSVDALCGYYIIRDNGSNASNYSNYAVTLLDGSITIIGAPQMVEIGARPFEGQQVGTIYAVSPEYAYTRLDTDDRGALVQGHATGTRLVFTAVPDDGYEVYDWYINGVAQGSKATSLAYVLLAEKTTIEVQFAIKQNTLIFGTAGDEGGGSIICSDSNLTSNSVVLANALFSFTAKANPGYHFKEWRYTELGKGTAYDNSDNGKMESSFDLLMPTISCSLYAVFERDFYTFEYADRSGANGLTAWYMGSATDDSTAALEKIYITSGDLVKGDTLITVEPANGYRLNTEYAFVSSGSQGTADYDAGKYTVTLTEDSTVTGWTDQMFFDLTLNFDVETTMTFPAGTQMTYTIDGEQYTFPYSATTPSLKLEDLPGGSEISVQITYPGYYDLLGWTNDSTVTTATDVQNKAANYVGLGDSVEAGFAYWYSETSTGSTRNWYFIAPATGNVSFDADAVTVYASGTTFELGALDKNESATVHLKEKPVHTVTIDDITGYGTYSITLPDGAEETTGSNNTRVIRLHDGDTLITLVTPSHKWTVSYWQAKCDSMSEPIKVRATSLKYAIENIQENYTFTPIFSSTTYNTISWPTINTIKNGLTLSPEKEYLSSVSAGSDFKFKLAGATTELLDQVFANGQPFVPANSENAGDYTYENGVYTISNIQENQVITVSMKNTGITVNGVDIVNMSGNGWTYNHDDQTLSITRSGLTISGTPALPSLTRLSIQTSSEAGNLALNELILTSSANPIFRFDCDTMILSLAGQNKLTTYGQLFNAKNLVIRGNGSLDIASMSIDNTIVTSGDLTFNGNGTVNIKASGNEYTLQIGGALQMGQSESNTSPTVRIQQTTGSTAIVAKNVITWAGELLVSNNWYGIQASSITSNGGIMELSTGRGAIVVDHGNWFAYYPDGYLLRYATYSGTEPHTETNFASGYSNAGYNIITGSTGQLELDYIYVRISPMSAENSTGKNVLAVTYNGKKYSAELSGDLYKYYYIDLDDKVSTTLKTFTSWPDVYGQASDVHTSDTGTENWLVVAHFASSPFALYLQTQDVTWSWRNYSELNHPDNTNMDPYKISLEDTTKSLDYELSGGTSDTFNNFIQVISGVQKLTLNNLTASQLSVGGTPVYLVGDNHLFAAFDTTLFTNGDLHLYSDGTGTLTLNPKMFGEFGEAIFTSALDATNLHLHNVKALTMYSGDSAISAGSNAKIYFYDGENELTYGQGWKIDQGTNAPTSTTLSSSAVGSNNYMKIYATTTDGSVAPQVITYDKSDTTNLNKTLSVTYGTNTSKLLPLVETIKNGVTYITLKLIDSEGNETELKLIKGDAIADGYNGFYTATTAGATLTLVMGSAGLDDLAVGDYTVRIPTKNSTSLDASLKISYTKTSTGGLSMEPNTVTLGRGQSVTFTSSFIGTTPSIYKWFVNGVEIENTGSNFLFTVPADAPIGTPITVTVKSYDGDTELGSATSTISVSASAQSIDITCEQETPSGDGSYTLYNTINDGTNRSWSFHSAVTMDSGEADMSMLSWSLWGNNLRATTIDSVTGVLTVSPKETGTNGKLQLIATYANSDGTTFVKVIDIYLSTDVWVEADNTGALNGQIGSVTFDGKDVTTGGYVPKDTTVTVTAQPAEGYTVKNWFVNGQSVMDDPNYTVDMVNKTLTFTAGLNSRTVITAEYINLGMVIVDFTGEGPGSVTAVVGDQSIAAGNEVRAESSVTFTATPTPFCIIKAWYINGELLEGYTESTLTLDMLMENTSVTVEFEAPERTVNVAVSEGGSLKATLNGQLLVGNSFTITTLDTLILEATPADGYRVKVWTMDQEAIQNNSCVIMPGVADVDVLVTFEKIPGYTVTVYTNSYENGTGQVISGETVIGMASSGTIAVGESQNLTLTAQPDIGCYLYGWTVNGTTYAANGNTLTLFNVTDDVTVTAKFRRSFYEVTLSAGTGGTIVGTYALNVMDNHYNGVVSVGESIRGGSAISLIITPDAGNRPASFTINGESVKLTQDVYTNIYTLTLDALVEDLQIEVTFETPEIFEVIIPNQFTEVKQPEAGDDTVEPDDPSLIDDTVEPVEPAEPIEQVTGQVTLEYIRDGLSTDGELTDTTQSANIAEGGSVILSFIPAEGYELNQTAIEEQLKAIFGEEGYAAKVSLHLTANGYQIRIVGIDQNLDLTSIENPFREKPEIPTYTITIPEIENGKLTVMLDNAVMESGAIVPEGTVLTVIVEADDHYKLILLQVNGVDCDGTFIVTEDMVIDAQFEMAHCYENVVVTLPTCTEGGYTTHTCIYCDDSYVDAHTELLGHSFTNYVSDNNATDTADGTKTAKCDRCDVTHTVIDEGSMLSLPDSITSDIFAVDESDIHKITSGTTVTELVDGINEKAYIKVYSGDQEVSGDTLIGTGMVVKLIIAGQVRDSVTVVVTGDISGDGKVTITDMLAMKSQLLQMSTLEGAYATAADLNGDGTVTVTDFVQIKAHILEKGSITAR